jgi:hypothetical protein
MPVDPTNVNIHDIVVFIDAHPGAGANIAVAVEARRIRLERAALEAQAAAAERAGEAQAAAALRAVPVVPVAPAAIPVIPDVPAPVVVPVAVKADGVVTVTRWHAEMEPDQAAIIRLIQAVAAGKAPVQALKADMVFLNQKATELKSVTMYPGVQGVAESTGERARSR